MAYAELLEGNQGGGPCKMAAGGRDGSFQESGASTGCFIDNLAPAICHCNAQNGRGEARKAGKGAKR